MLHHPQTKTPISSQGDEIRFPFPEGIAYFSHGDEGASVGIVAEVDRDRIKNIPCDPWKGEESNATDRSRDTLMAEVIRYIPTDRISTMIDMVTLTKTIETGSVKLKKMEAGIELVEFVEINQEVKNPVEELMLLGVEPFVKNRAFIKAGIYGERLHPIRRDFSA
jgi:hypothetical protein